MSAASDVRAQAHPRSAGGQAAAEIKLIHIGRSALHMPDDEYRALIHGVSGGRTTSSKDLKPTERQRVLARLKALGFELKRKPATDGVAMIRLAQMRKLRAMWYALADVGAVERPASPEACNDAIQTWAASRLKDVQALRFADGRDMSELIEQMKAWGERVGADVHTALPSEQAEGYVAADRPVGGA